MGKRIGWDEIDVRFVSRRVNHILKVDWSELVCPLSGMSFIHYRPDVAFELFRWMVESGGGYSRKMFVSGVYQLLNMRPSCTGGIEVDGFTGKDWREELHKRFRYAVLCWAHHPEHDGAVSRWRKRHGIRYGHTSKVPVDWRKLEPAREPRYGWCQDGLRDVLDRLLTLRGTLRRSHNECYADARLALRFVLKPVTLDYQSKATAWKVVCKYGCPCDLNRWGELTSSWYLTVARQERGELFAAFIVRAHDAALRLLGRSPKKFAPYRGEWE